MSIKFYSDKQVSNIKGWHWIETDSGAWDGPKSDWENSHSLVIKEFVRNYRTVIQAGGNCGMYPKLLSQLFQRVYTFEPDSLNFQCLNLNCTEENIIKIQSALGLHSDFCEMNRLTMHNVGMHIIKEDRNGSIPIMKLDSFNFKDVDLLMLDLEQYEYPALLGAIQLLKNCHPVVFVERPSLEVSSLMSDLGYRAITQSEMDTVFI